MKLLFIQGGSRWKIDNKDNWYTDANFNNKIWNRYISLADKLTVVLRKESKVYTVEEAKRKYNIVDKSMMECIALEDVYKPLINVFNFKLKTKQRKMIENQVKNADKIIIRSLGNFYTNTALYYAKKYNKSYLVEVTGFIFESLWYHDIKGKFIALIKDLQYKANIKDSAYACYVTNQALQKRYPIKGKSLGCSDVEICFNRDEVIERKSLRNVNNNFVLGTAAFLDVGWKGQKDVIKSIKFLKDSGITNIEYQLIGGGTGEKLISLAQNLGIENQIKVIGPIPHQEVFEWLKNIDIYVQPSYQEGLCRAIVEAMSQGCTVIASNVGGNYELVNSENLYKKKKYIQLAKIIEKNLNKDKLQDGMLYSLDIADRYREEQLDIKRNLFYTEFIDKK